MKTVYLKFITLIFILTWLCFSFAYSQRIVSFQSKNGITLKADIDPKTGCAKRIFDIKENIHQYGFEKSGINYQTIDNLGKQLIDDYIAILKVSSQQVKPKKTDTDGSWWFVDYEQTYAGIPVYSSEIGFTIDPQGIIVSLGARAFPKIDVTTVANIMAPQAITTSIQHFQCDSIIVKEAPQLVILPIENDSSYTYNLVWKLELMSERPHKDYVYFVDATNGKVVKEYSNVMEAELYGYITGNYYPVRVNDPPVNGEYSTTNIKIYNVLGQLVATRNTDANGYYYVGGIAYASYYVQVPLENSWIKMKNDADGGNPIKVSISTIPGKRDYDWAAGEGPNVRWHASRIHDFFKSAPFNYSSMDYKMEGHINAVDEYGNPRNGAADGTNIYFGTQSGQYWTRSSDVVYHEYTHNTTYHIYSGWIGTDWYSKGRAMDEGFADYFACTINNDPIQGEDVGVNRNLDNNTWEWADYGGPYYNGQVIGGACWDLRQSVGQSVTDNLVFKAMQVSPHARNFTDFLLNMLTVDNSAYNGTHRNEIRAAFSNHGITVPYLSVLISGPTEVSHPALKGLPPYIVTWTANVSGGLFAPFNYLWTKNGSQVGTGSTYTETFGYAGGGGGSRTWTLSVSVSDAINQNANASMVVTEYFGSLLDPKIASYPSEQKGIQASFAYEIPETFMLLANYPNPFNPETIIAFAIPEPAQIKIVLYDILGREVANLFDGTKPAGYHSVRWNSSDREGNKVMSGMYFCLFNATGESGKQFKQTIKMLLTK